jgi:hypothetical protein
MLISNINDKKAAHKKLLLFIEMIKYKNLIIFIKNLPHLLIKRRRVLYVPIFTLAIIISFLFLQNLSTEKKDSVFDDKSPNANVIEYKKLKNDDNLDTSSYSEEYKKYNEIKLVYKQKSDSFNSALKTVVENTRREEDIKKKKYLIVEYTKVFEKEKYCHKSIAELYVKECKYKNCYFSCSKDQVNTADALLFHETDLKQQISNKDKKLLEFFYKRVDNLNQIWILWDDEANKIPVSLNSIGFNWTFSYRLDAEVSDCAYGCKYKIQNQTNSNYKAFLDELRENFNRRSASSIWFVSNCKSYYRIKFALELGQYFPVNVQGQCQPSISLMKKYGLEPDSFIGEIIFPIYNELYRKDKKCAKGSNCEINMLMNSKFYLSFESKNCSFYITEKFWSILRIGLIPVVIQPAKSFYESIAPKDSFIHAQDFNFDPKLLAAYLKKISSNFDLYSKYLTWKYSDDIAHSGNNCEVRRLCELCTRMNTETSQIYYKNAADWFNNACEIN